MSEKTSPYPFNDIGHHRYWEVEVPPPFTDPETSVVLRSEEDPACLPGFTPKTELGKFLDWLPAECKPVLSISPTLHYGSNNRHFWLVKTRIHNENQADC